MDLLSGDLVAIDGSKFKAVNRPDRNFTRKQLKRTIQKLDEDIDRYLDQMDEVDAEEPDEKKLTAEEIQEKIEEMKRQRAEAEKIKKEAMLLISDNPLVACSSGDPEALSKFGHAVVIQQVIFNKSLSLLTHSNTFPRHGTPPPQRRCKPCPDNMCQPCCEYFL